MNGGVLFLLTFSFCFLVSEICASKTRSWIGPVSFVEGIIQNRARHGFAAIGSNIYMFGGSSGSAIDLLFAFNTDTQTLSVVKSVSGTVPAGGTGTRIAAEGGELYAFGGLLTPGNYLGNLYKFNPAMLAWTTITPADENSPIPRYGHGFASCKGMLYMHGGNSKSGWTIHCTTDSCSCIDRQSFCCICNACCRYCRVMPQQPHNGQGFLADLYRFDPGELVWTDLTAAFNGTSPSPRYDHGFTCCGDLLYVYGGNSDSGFLADLYSLDPTGGAWTLLSSAAVSGTPPSPRTGHGFTCCGVALYVHGGYGGSDFQYGNLADLHRFDPMVRAWIDMSSSVRGAAPSSRYYHGFTCCGDMLYVHGGIFLDPSYQTVYLGDLLSFDPVGLTWAGLTTGLSGPAPSPRYGHGFTCCGTLLYTHGGKNTQAYFANLFRFNPAERAWSDVSTAVGGTAPSPRYLHGFTCCGNMLYVHGGQYNSVDFGDLHRFDLVERRWSNFSSDVNGTPPSTRSGHGFSCAEGALYVHGGFGFGGRGIFGDLHRFDPGDRVWVDLTSVSDGAAPPPRYQHGFTSCQGILYVHGGRGRDGGFLGDLHRFDPAGWTWSDLSSAVSGNPPLPRYSHGFTCCGGALYLYGGYDGYSRVYLGDLHRFDPVALTWTELTSVVTGTAPTSRYQHGFTCCGGMLYVHGGVSRSGVLGDLRAIRSPQDFNWTMDGLIQLSFVFDWDVVKVSPGSPFIVFHVLELCTGSFPCILRVVGGGASNMIFSSNGSLICSSRLGCMEVSVHSVGMLCTHEQSYSPTSALQTSGSVLKLSSVNVSGCRSQVGGSVVQAYAGAVVVIKYCHFSSLFSTSMGGALLFLGSSVTVEDSVFSNISAATGGGCIYAGPDSCVQRTSGQQQSVLGSSWLNVSRTQFLNCSSKLDGGSITVYSQLGSGEVWLDVYDCTFQGSTALSTGGSIFVMGDKVHAAITISRFLKSFSSVGGGAVSMSAGSVVRILQCNFSDCWSTMGGALLASSESGSGQVLLDVYDSFFNGSFASTTGGSVCATGENVKIAVTDSGFFSSSSLVGGGAVSLNGGSVVSILRCNFFDCWSGSGGSVLISPESGRGAAWLDVDDCSFQNSFASSRGGSVRSTGENVQVSVGKSKFLRSSSLVGGGAVSVSGGSVFSITLCNFSDCWSGSGGALMVDTLAEVSFTSPRFTNTTAYGDGGGAIQIHDGGFLRAGCWTAQSAAPHGGGGLLLWQGKVNRPKFLRCPAGVQGFFEPCGGDSPADCGWLTCGGCGRADDNNSDVNIESLAGWCSSMSGLSAQYGPCLASGFSRLLTDGAPSQHNASFAGFDFTIAVTKIDSYGQIIKSDSSSILQAFASSNGSIKSAELAGNTFASFVGGIATFTLSVQPYFTKIDFASSHTMLLSNPVLYFQGTDSQSNQLIRSPDEPVVLRGDIDVCPRGYIVVLASNPSDGNVSGHGQCKRCEGGSYSVNPLARSPGMSSLTPSCLNCPVGGDCSRGGDLIAFSIGRWMVDRGMYLLVFCPPGHKLVNTSSSGAFWHDGQVCRPCQRGQYIIDSVNDECRDCPPGANCSADGKWTIQPLVPGSTFEVFAGIWQLVGCPGGHYLQDSQCFVCPAGSYCTGGTFSPSPCGADLFTRAGAANSDDCSPAVFVSVAVTLNVVREAFAANNQFVSAVANNAQRPAGDVIITGIVQQGSGLEVTADVACPNAVVAAAVMAQLTQSDGVDMSVAGIAGARVVSVTVTACEPGYALLASKTCGLCYASYYCLGGSVPMQPCPSSTAFSKPGANSSSACFSTTLVTMLLDVPLAKSELNASVLDRFQRAISSAAGVDINMVVVQIYNGNSASTQTRRNEIETPWRSELKGYDVCIRSLSDAFTPIPALIHNIMVEMGASNKLTPAFQRLVEVSNEFLHKYRSSGICNLKLDSGRRTVVSSTKLNVQIAAGDTNAASTVASRLNPSSLSSSMQDEGLPSPTIESLTVAGALPGSGSNTPLPLILGLTLGGSVLIALLVWAFWYVVLMLWKQRRFQTFVKSLACAEPGDAASSNHLPLELARYYKPESIIGKGSFGCVVRAKLQGSEWSVAIKLVVPNGGLFDDKDLRQLQREQHMLELLTSARVEQAVHLADSVRLPPGVEGAVVHPHISWFIMELLEGSSLGALVKEQYLFGDKECIAVARDSLAAIKVMHGEGVIHRDIKPDNIIRCRATKPGVEWDCCSYLYKLVDFGTSLGVDEAVARKQMMTLQSKRAMGMGTAAYMSPEMFLEPDNAWYPTDLWSLGVSLFELCTGRLPFQAENDLAFSMVVAGKLDEASPNLLDYLDEERRSHFDLQLAKVLSKAMSKKVSERFSSVDEMYEAVYMCLVVRGEAIYSCFISYRVASEAPLARLLFDELNHSVTPGGHRVTVYWDAFRLVKGEDWEEGFATGLLNSLCFLPLLSYGATAPLAALPEHDAKRSALLAEGWDERPVHRKRLEGRETDQEDNVLKELLVAATLLQRRQQGCSDAGHKLKTAYPILVGRQHPRGHPAYPAMGEYFLIQGGGGQLPKQPSPPTCRAVEAFLKGKGGLSEEDAAEVLKRSPAWAVESFTRLQGCQLWSHAADLQGVELNKQQMGLVGKGFSGPAVDLGGTRLTAEQREACRGGLDEKQLRMLKAEVRAARAAVHEVIDRAVAQQDPAETTELPSVLDAPAKVAIAAPPEWVSAELMLLTPGTV